MKKLTIKKAGNIVEILGIKINSTSTSSVLNLIIVRLERGEKTFVVTPNPEFLVSAKQNLWFRKILDSATLAIPDGIGLIWAGKILGRPFAERVSGADLMERLCQEASRRKWRVYFFGGEGEVANKTLGVLKKQYPGLTGWAESGPLLRLVDGEWTKDSQEEIGKALARINQKSPELLFVALGMEKQEKFIFDNWQKLNVKFAMGVGGAFDYLSGKTPRAPVCIRSLGFEWFWRLVCEPWRWRRQQALLKFIWLVLKEKRG